VKTKQEIERYLRLAELAIVETEDSESHSDVRNLAVGQTLVLEWLLGRRADPAGLDRVEKLEAKSAVKKVKTQQFMTTIREIGRTEFHSHLYGTRTDLTTLLVDEVSYFTTEKDLLMGIVIFHKLSQEWGWDLLGQCKHGNYCSIKALAPFENAQAAEASLKKALVRVLLSGKKVFPCGKG
jgi:hypothetical protein